MAATVSGPRTERVHEWGDSWEQRARDHYNLLGGAAAFPVPAMGAPFRISATGRSASTARTRARLGLPTFKLRLSRLSQVSVRWRGLESPHTDLREPAVSTEVGMEIFRIDEDRFLVGL